MKISEILNQAKIETGPQGDHLGIEVLLAFVSDKDRSFLFSHGDTEVDPSVFQKFQELFERFMLGEPVAYLTGKKEFYGLEFSVDSRVLIPRPETEHLVERVLREAGLLQAPPSILDVGTGSGCIAISVAKHLPDAQIVGVDISAEAIEVAKRNAEHHGVVERVSFFQSDLFEHVTGPFDIVVANLPYIGEKKFSFVSKSAFEFEPHLALFGGEDGLDLYRRFFSDLAKQPWKPKLVLGEFGFLQKDELSSLFLECYPTMKISFEQDYAHIDRMFVVEFAEV